MLIRHLTIGGLRSYAPAPQRIALAPLTLVFGPNSAGKSSLLSVLPMLAQTAVRPDVLSMSGDLVEGGSFRMAVHRHDQSAPMTLGFGWTSGEGVARSAAISFTWDPARRAAIRSHTELADGDEQASIEGPRPWGDQPGVALHHRVTEEFWGTLQRVYFVGPMRARAERTTLVGQGADDYVGPSGEEMAAVLHARPDLVAAVNLWCDRLGLGYHVRMLDPVSQDIVMTAGEFAVLALEDVRRDPPVLVSSRGVGYGVGQLLPIIVQSLLTQSGLILVEQPEVHLHPRLQAAAGDLFVDTVVSGRAQLLIETHSEHLVLRLLRRVREGVLAPEDLAILYVDLDDAGAAFVRRLEVDAEGDLVDGWPGGFFDERLAEVLGGRP
ncbi:MAG: AAA family ATPase [Candidatus Nanopelagicales bacterium]|nr:AAA family ATPase [Candidatus Nanopelagicales bacterium]